MKAQQRSGSKDAVHLFDSSEKALCTGKPMHELSIDWDRDVFSVEFPLDEYLIVEEEVIGKVCKNCKRIAEGTMSERINND
jgi:hypothetical protein